MEYVVHEMDIRCMLHKRCRATCKGGSIEVNILERQVICSIIIDHAYNCLIGRVERLDGDVSRVVEVA